MVFSDEVGEGASQSFSYMIPVQKTRRHPLFLDELLLGLRDIEILFPCTFAAEEIVLASRLAFPEITFNVELLNRGISFEPNFDFCSSLYGADNRRSCLSRKYVGSYGLLAKDHIEFVELLPIDIDEMNSLYLDHAFVFVGLTQSFGGDIDEAFSFNRG